MNTPEMTELFDADIDRVDLVSAAANGTRFLLAKSGNPGLIPADTVRELVKGAETTAMDATLDAVVKAGRALSAANETKLRAAAESIQTVLDSLPKPDPTLIKENPAMADETTAPAAPEAIEKTATDPEQQPETDLAEATVAKSADEALAEVVKADGLIAVYDATGCLVGVVKPNAITPVEGPGTTDPDADGDSVADTDGDGDGELPADDAPVVEAAADGPNVTEADGSSQIDGQTYGDESPVEEAAADAPAPSDDDDEDSRVIPGTHTVQSPAVRKTAAETDLAAVLKEALAPLAEKVATVADLASQFEVLKERVEKFGAQPDNRAIPAFNGAATGANAGLAHRDTAAGGDVLEPLRKALADAQEAGNSVEIEKAKTALLFESVRNRFENPLH